MGVNLHNAVTSLLYAKQKQAINRSCQTTTSGESDVGERSKPTGSFVGTMPEAVTNKQVA